jgi:hypothetical protein
MKRMFVIGIALLFFSLNLRLTGANDDSSWSSSVDGLQARLSFERGKTLNGTPLISTYLELRNVADIGGVMELPLNLDRIQFKVVDEQDRILPQGPNVYDEVTVEVDMLRMPHDSYLRFNISHHGAGVSKNEGALLDLGSSYVWRFTRGDRHSYYLRGQFSVEPSTEGRWAGTIEMPKVKIPTAQ